MWAGDNYSSLLYSNRFFFSFPFSLFHQLLRELDNKPYLVSLVQRKGVKSIEQRARVTTTAVPPSNWSRRETSKLWVFNAALAFYFQTTTGRHTLRY